MNREAPGRNLVILGNPFGQDLAVSRSHRRDEGRVVRRDGIDEHDGRTTVLIGRIHTQRGPT
jgi:hypothetical protein